MGAEHFRVAGSTGSNPVFFSRVGSNDRPVRARTAAET